MIKRVWFTIRLRLREPVLVDRKIDVCAAVMWVLISLWGIFAAISESTVVASATTPDYSIPWGLSIGVLALIAAGAAIATLFAAPPRIRIVKKSIELISVSLMGGLISVFPLLKVAALFEHHFDSASIASAALAAVFLVFPTWRIFHLTERIRGLRKIEGD